MNSWHTKNGYRVFQVLSGRSNVFLISAADQIILVDTGYHNAYKRLRQNIDVLDFSNKHIDFLILTHTHYDHCQNAASLQRAEKCKVIVSAHEAGYIKDGYTPLPKGTMLLTKPLPKLGNLIGKKKFGYAPFTADIIVDEKLDLSDYGLKIELIHTGGHSPGSISVIVDGEFALVGDAMYKMFKNYVLPPFADNRMEMVESWKKLLETSCNIFLPGHGTSVSRELLQEQYEKFAPKFANVV